MQYCTRTLFQTKMIIKTWFIFKTLHIWTVVISSKSACMLSYDVITHDAYFFLATTLSAPDISFRQYFLATSIRSSLESVLRMDTIVLIMSGTSFSTLLTVFSTMLVSKLSTWKYMYYLNMWNKSSFNVMHYVYQHNIR